MNGLVWYLYFADIASGVLNAFIVITIISAIITGIASVIYCIEYSSSYDGLGKAVLACIKSWIKYSICVFIISVVVAILTPTPRTIYAAAGLKVIEQSETGQMLTDDMKSILQDIKTIIHKQAGE